MRARGTFFSKKHVFLGLTPVYSETTALSKSCFKLKLQIVREFLQKRLFFKSQKVSATSYYGIEDPLPDLNSKLRLFPGQVRLGSCQEPPVVSTKRAITM